MEPLRPDTTPKRGGFCLLTHPTQDERVIAFITERPRSEHRFQVVTPHGSRLMTQDAFMRIIPRLKKRLSVAPRWYSAMEGAGNVCEKQQVLQHLAHRLPGYTLADDPSGRRTDPTPYDRSGPGQGRKGADAHTFRDERVPCPACDGADFCDYCAGAGKVSPADADVIRRQMGAKESEPIG